MGNSWSTRVVDGASHRYDEWRIDALPPHLRRNSLDYYYLSVWPGLRHLEPVTHRELPPRVGSIEYAYMHIPYCSGVCDFCSYFLTASATARSDDAVNAYIDRLVAQARIHQRQADVSLSHVYLGGGTPSLLSPGQVARLFDGLADADMLGPTLIGTMECHPELFEDPGSLDALLDVLERYGIRRVSIGFQTSDAGVLDATHRRHDAEFLVDAVRRLRDRGFMFNVDLMYGLPGQTLLAWVASLEVVLAVRPDSVSTYFTFVDYGTALWRAAQKDESLLSSHADTQMCHIAAQVALEEAGYFELPNDFHAVPHGDPTTFRQDCLPSAANSMALGVGSYGYYPGVQYFNEFNFSRYAHAVDSGTDPVWRAAVLSSWEELCRDIMFSFKNAPALNLPLFVARHGKSPLESHEPEFEELQRLELVQVGEDAIQLTPKGRLVAEEIACMFEPARSIGATASRAESYLVRKHNFAPTYARHVRRVRPHGGKEFEAGAG